jgi:hypothetical protein
MLQYLNSLKCVFIAFYANVCGFTVRQIFLKPLQHWDCEFEFRSRYIRLRKPEVFCVPSDEPILHRKSRTWFPQLFSLSETEISTSFIKIAKKNRNNKIV